MIKLSSIHQNHLVLNCLCGHVGQISVQDLIEVYGGDVDVDAVQRAARASQISKVLRQSLPKGLLKDTPPQDKSIMGSLTCRVAAKTPLRLLSGIKNETPLYLTASEKSGRRFHQKGSFMTSPKR